MKKTMDLCMPCAELMREAYDLSKTATGANNKITCAHYSRRRYGATYEVTPKRRGGVIAGIVDAVLGLGMTPKEGEVNG